MGFRVQRDAVGDRSGDVVFAHDSDVPPAGSRRTAAGVIGLESSAVARSVIDEVDPGFVRAGFLGVVERSGYELGEVGARRHVAHRRFLVAEFLSVVETVTPRGEGVFGIDRRRVFDGELDRGMLGADLDGLIEHNRLDVIEIIVAVAVDAEFEDACPSLGGKGRDHGTSAGEIAEVLLRRTGPAARPHLDALGGGQCRP